MTDSAVKLPSDFDPWYVLLSPPEKVKEKDSYLLTKPTFEVQSIEVDYRAIAAAAEEDARQLIDKRWKDIHTLSPVCQAAKVLSSKQIRNGKSLGVEQYLTQVLGDSKEGVTFALPSFPFKIPNPMKVAHRNLDAGELLCLRRLHYINSIVQMLMDVPSSFVIISDGKIYSDICDIDASEYKQYTSDARRAIAKMGLADELKYVDMLDTVIGDRLEEYQDTLNVVSTEIAKWWEKNRETARVKYLISNMSANVNTFTEDYSLMRSCGNGVIPDALWNQYKKLVNDKAESKAREFMCKLVTLRIMDAVPNRYPGSVRATVHPKEGQFGIHLVNASTFVFPWQGTTLRKTGDKFRVVPTQTAWDSAKYEIRDSETNNILYYSEIPADTRGGF